MSDCGFIYIRTHNSYDEYKICKLGHTTDLFSRNTTYITGEYFSGKYVLILKYIY